MAMLTLVQDKEAYCAESVHSVWYVVRFEAGKEKGTPLFRIWLNLRRYTTFDWRGTKNITTNANRAVSVAMVWPGYRYDMSYHLGRMIAKMTDLGLDTLEFTEAAMDAGWDIG